MSWPETVKLGPAWRDTYGYGSAILERSEPLAFEPRTTPRRFFVTSLKTLKIDAARQLAEDLFGIQVEVAGYGAPSGVTEQPVGDEARRGAKNRAAAIVREPGDCVVSIENGIFFEPLDPVPEWTRADEYVSPRGVAVDRAVVVVAFEDEIHEGVGSGVLVPRRFAEASEASGWSVTAGHAMAEAWGVPQDAWHASVVGVDRTALIRSAWWPRA